MNKKIKLKSIKKKQIKDSENSSEKLNKELKDNKGKIWLGDNNKEQNENKKGGIFTKSKNKKKNKDTNKEKKIKLKKGGKEKKKRREIERLKWKETGKENMRYFSRKQKESK